MVRRYLGRFVGVSLAALVGAGCGESEARKQAKRGEAIFVKRCAVCHGTGSAGAQGPGLGGVLGRKTGSAAFAYSPAMRASGFTWDAATLDRFLEAPAQLVPGTTMPIATPDDAERRALVAYLGTLQPATAPARASEPRPVGDASGFGDYRGDAPGVRRHITVADLPAPFATPSARNSPSVVERPAGALPVVPPGFQVALFADGLEEPRAIRVAPNGDAFVSESAAGQIRVLRAKDGAARAEQVEVFATGLDHPFGMAFFPPGPRPAWIYVANTNEVVRFPYALGDVHAKAPPQLVVAKLADSAGGHWTRDVAFSPDGARMFVSVGSGSNVAEDMPKAPPPPIPTWEASHGLGAAWGDEERRADVRVFTPDGKDEETFATGIRNCVGLAVQPQTGELWCSTNERDGLGDDLVPDYVTRVRRGAFYGWPWFYLGNHVDPRHDGERPDLAGKVTVPDVLLQAHSASLEMTFYDGAMFPAELRGSAFAALHGSWNRGVRTGPKVVRIVVKDGLPTGEYEDFMTGFVADEGHVWARPVGVAVAHDGALLVSEDGNGTLWRVSRK
jgi:glucose/arabinose dehydrogenase